jgi:hypothetical protein
MVMVMGNGGILVCLTCQQACWLTHCDAPRHSPQSDYEYFVNLVRWNEQDFGCSTHEPGYTWPHHHQRHLHLSALILPIYLAI